MLRRWVIAIGGFVLIGAMGLHIPRVRDGLSRWIQRWIYATYGWSVDWQRLTWNAWLTRITVKDFTWRVSPTGPPFLTIPRLVLHLHWWRSWIPYRVEVESPRLTLETDESGQWQIPPWQGERVWTGPFPTLHLSAGWLEAVELPHRVRLRVSPIEVRASPIPTGYRLRLQAWVYGQVGRFRGPRLRARLYTEWNRSGILTLRLRLSDPRNPSLGLTVRTHLDLRQSVWRGETRGHFHLPLSIRAPSLPPDVRVEGWNPQWTSVSWRLYLQARGRKDRGVLQWTLVPETGDIRIRGRCQRTGPVLRCRVRGETSTHSWVRFSMGGTLNPTIPWWMNGAWRLRGGFYTRSLQIPWEWRGRFQAKMGTMGIVRSSLFFFLEEGRRRLDLHATWRKRIVQGTFQVFGRQTPLGQGRFHLDTEQRRWRTSFIGQVPFHEMQVLELLPPGAWIDIRRIHISAAGTLEQPTWQVDWTVAGRGRFHPAIGTLRFHQNGRGAGRGDRAAFQIRMQWWSQASREAQAEAVLRVRGRFAGAWQWESRLRLRAWPLYATVPPLVLTEAQGRLRGQIAGPGIARRLRVQGSVQWTDVIWRDISLGPGTFHIAPERAGSYRVLLTWPAAGWTLRGQWSPDGGWTVYIWGQNDALTLADHRLAYRAEVQGTGRGLSPKALRTARWSVQVYSLVWKYRTKTMLRLDSPLHFTVRGRWIQLEEAGRWSGLLGSGAVNSSNATLHVVHQFSLRRLKMLVPTLSRIQGRVVLDIRIPNRWDAWTRSAWSLTILNLRLPRGYRMDRCVFRGNWSIQWIEGGPCLVERLSEGRAPERWSLVAEGTRLRISLERGYPGVWLSWWFPAMASDPGSVQIRATLRWTPRWRFTATVSNLTWSHWGIPFETVGALRLEWTPGRWRFDLRALRIGGEPMDLFGEIRRQPTGERSRWAVDVQWRGSLDLTILQAVLPWSIAGTLRGSLQVSGPLNRPLVIGELTVTDGEVWIRESGIRFAPIRLRAQVTGIEDVWVWVNARGIRGHWTFTLRGGWDPGRSRFIITTGRWEANDLLLMGAAGWFATVQGFLTLDTQGLPWRLRGEITVPHALISTSLHPAFRDEAGAMLSLPVPIQWDVRFRLDQGDVQSQWGRFTSQGQWLIRGPLEAPIVDGEWWIHPGGVLHFQGQVYQITRARLMWLRQPPLSPQVDIVLEAALPTGPDSPTGVVQIRVEVMGSARSPVVRLSSDPPRPEADILAMVMTGTAIAPTSEPLRGGASLVGQAMVLALGGQVAAGLIRPLARRLGIASVSLQPIVASADLEPTARITLERPFAPWLRAVFSTDVRDTTRQTWMVMAQPVRWLQTRLIRTDEAVWALGLFPQWSVGGPRWGKRAPPQPVPPPRITAIEIHGDPPWPLAVTRRLLGLRSGDPFRIDEIQRRAERLERMLHRMGYWGAQVVWFPSPVKGGRAYRLNVRIHRGPRFRLVVAPDLPVPPPDVWMIPCWRGHIRISTGRGCMRHRWSQWARFQGLSPAGLQITVTPGTDVWTVHVEISQPVRRRVPRIEWSVRLEVPSNIPNVSRPVWDLNTWSRACEEAAGRAPFWWWLRHRPEVCRSVWKAQAQASGWTLQDMTVRWSADGRVGWVHLTLVPQVIRSVSITGWPQQVEVDRRPLEALRGSLFIPKRVQAVVDDACQRLVEAGYMDAQCRWSWRASTGRLHVTVHLGSRSVLGEVFWMNTPVQAAWFQRLTGLRPGRPLRPADLERARRRLLNMGIFQHVRVFMDPESPPDRRRVHIETVPQPIVRLSGGVRYNLTREAWETELDTRLRDPWQWGWQATASFQRLPDRWRYQVNAAWAHGFGYPVVTRIGYRFERETQADVLGTFVTEERTWSLEQIVSVHPHWSIRYRYHPKFIHIFEETPSPPDPLPFDLTFRVRRLGVGLLWDTRDAPMAPRRGHLLGLDVEYAPGWLGSEIRYIKTFVQWSHYVSMDRWTGLWSVRAGWAWPLGEEVLFVSERFFAGGASSFRGVSTRTLGPRNPFTGKPAGGEALWLVNLEWTRWISQRWGVATFLDMGDVFSKVRDFHGNPFRLRKAWGIGLRWLSPIGLIRLDTALLLNPRPAERRFHVWVAIGPVS